jgi:hypothetical protein
VAFTPPSSLAVAVVGPVAVTGPLTNAELRAAPVDVDGTVNVGNFPADQVVHFTTPQAVTGPLTDAQLRASRVPVDASGATVPVSVAVLPLPAGAATADEQARSRRALNDVALTAILERDKLEP